MREGLVTVVSAAIIKVFGDGRARILLAQRGPGSYQGCWVSPGGKVAAGETTREALLRELREEVQCDQAEVSEVLYTYSGEMITTGGKFYLVCFLCVPSEEADFKPNPKEKIVSVRWFTAEEVDLLPLAVADAANRRVVMACLRRMETPDRPPLSRDEEVMRSAEALGAWRLQQERLAEIGEAIAMQDNLATEAPIFVVQQERSRVVSADSDYDVTDPVWVDLENASDSINADTQADLEKRFAEGENVPSNYVRAQQVKWWEFVTVCFTRKGCEDYLRANGHNLGKTRIYIYGSHRNDEWCAVREHLIGLARKEGV